MTSQIRPNRLRLVIFPIRVVTEYQRMVVFRLGRISGVRGPGLVWLLPFFDRVMTIDMRESFLEIPHQTSITKDNAPISIDFITFFKVIDPEASVVQVANFAESAHNIAATTLRSWSATSPSTTCWRSATTSTRCCA